MNKLVFIAVVLFSITSFTAELQGQKIPSLEYKQQNELVPKIPYGMSYQEFQMLNREMNWKQLIIAMVVPGYLHFYADRPTWGWSIFGVRMAGFGLMMWGMIDQWKYFGTLDWSSDYIKGNEARAERNIYLFMGGIAINMFAYGFDWAHADIVIEEDRNSIMYKYGIRHWKIGYTAFNNADEYVPGVRLTVGLK